jgi:hypothetical protein
MFECVMPYARDPDYISPPPPHTPLCTACGKQMRLLQSRPSVSYVNLDDCTFKCECGERADYVMARLD